MISSKRATAAAVAGLAAVSLVAGCSTKAQDGTGSNNSSSGGGGGGRDEVAQGGGTDTGALADALGAVRRALEAATA